MECKFENGYYNLLNKIFKNTISEIAFILNTDD